MAIEHLDVLIVGAGLSGIGAAVHMKREHPHRSLAILEGREQTGGTWDLFRYPGIRSDSDMYTLGYAFKPWTAAKAIADGPSILAYIRETAREHDIERHIRLGHRVRRASWSTDDAQWTVEVERGPERTPLKLTCGFLLLCAGYYKYEHGYTPDFPGIDQFKGTVVHPQHWPEQLDYRDQRVVVIGSGATAITLVPSMTDQARHVTMLQRTPTYVVSLPGEDALANSLKRLLPERTAYAVTRWKNVLTGMLFYRLSRRYPNFIKRVITREVQRAIGREVDVGRHFTPSYKPWDQRVCMVPDGDLFEAIRQGKASVVTDHIDTFTATGIRLKSGQELPADLVVTATGLDLVALGGIALHVDGQGIDLHRKISYKGMMLAGVPNLAYVIGYTNASWTLKADLTCEYVCRVLRHMDKLGMRQCMAKEDPRVRAENWIDFTSGYIRRSLDKFPKQGDHAPWKLHQNYALDIITLKLGALDDGTLTFSNPAATAAPIAA